jgi:hypothetical protein
MNQEEQVPQALQPRDYIWRKKINALLGKRMSLEEIAEKLNAEKVPTIHGTNKWTAASVRKAFVS